MGNALESNGAILQPDTNCRRNPVRFGTRELILDEKVPQSAEKATDKTGSLSALVIWDRVIQVLCAASEANDLFDAGYSVGG